MYCVRECRSGAESLHRWETGWNAFGCMAAEFSMQLRLTGVTRLRDTVLAVNRVEPRATVSVIGDGGLFVYPQKDIEKMRKRGYE